MSDLIYQSEHAGTTIDEAVSKVPTLEEQINSFTPHLSDLVTDADGVHGIKIESGTFTPYITFGSASAGVTYNTQYGSYARVGNIVAFEVNITLSNKGTSTGAAKIEGFPFATNFGRGEIIIDRVVNLEYPTGANTISVELYQNTLSASGANTGYIEVRDTNFKNDTDLRFTGSFRIA